MGYGLEAARPEVGVTRRISLESESKADPRAVTINELTVNLPVCAMKSRAWYAAAAPTGPWLTIAEDQGHSSWGQNHLPRIVSGSTLRKRKPTRLPPKASMFLVQPHT